MQRNRPRFPADFMLQLTNQELMSLRSQIVISNDRQGRGGRRYLPFAFTEQGVAMLSSILRSPAAVAIKQLVESMRSLIAAPPVPKRRPIGFVPLE